MKQEQYWRGLLPILAILVVRQLLIITPMFAMEFIVEDFLLLLVLMIYLVSVPYKAVFFHMASCLLYVSVAALIWFAEQPSLQAIQALVMIALLLFLGIHNLALTLKAIREILNRKKNSPAFDVSLSP